MVGDGSERVGPGVGCPKGGSFEGRLGQAWRGVVGDHAPFIRAARAARTTGTADEDVSGQHSKVVGAPLKHTADVFDAGDPTGVADHRYVDVLDVEVHQAGVVEDTPPAITNKFPAHDGLPAGVDAHG